MKMMILVLSTLTSASAFACFDRDAKPLRDPYQALQYLRTSSESFNACLGKMEVEGVQITKQAVEAGKLTATRKNKKPGDTSPVGYTIMVQGADRAGKQTRIYISYNIPAKAFTCESVTRNIPRCM